MKLTKRNTIFSIIILLIVYFSATYQLPYYIQKPGSADALDPIVRVADGYSSEGEMHLVTVSGLQATPIHYLLAQVLPHNDIHPIEEIFPEGISQEDYMHAQLEVMESSQEASLVVAYETANRDIEIDYIGVYVVAAVENMPADGKLQTGDLIVAIDGIEIKEAEDLISYVESKKHGDVITIDFVRDDKEQTTDVLLEYFDDESDRVGIGISLVTDREVTVDPEVHFASGNIGGPSAGLMFALEIYDQLLQEDITKGYKIAGTGEIDYEGNIYRVGGVDKKVVAADRKGIEVFFAPHENGREDSNYQLALQTAKEIDTNMQVVPVDSFFEALDYLENLSRK